MSDTITICDVGARGQLHPRWSRILDRLHVIAIDADPDARIEKPRVLKFEVHPVALWSTAAQGELRLTRSIGSSSLYEPNHELLARFPDAARFTVDERRPVKLVPLKTVTDQIHFLKIDAQGAELEILRGTNLDGVIGVEVEVSFAPLYVGAPLFGEVDQYLRKKGFELFDINRVYWRDQQDRKMRCVFGEALYFKPSAGDIYEALTHAYRLTIRQSMAHAFQSLMRYWFPSNNDSDMQIGH